MATSKRGNEHFLQINGIDIPVPAPTYSIVTAQGVSAGRNASNQVVGQLVGRRQYKINNLQWNGLKPEEWKLIMNAIEPFYVKVTFTTDKNERISRWMYPSDTEGKPFIVKDMEYQWFENCKFNLIDLGWDD